jgi:hypothetical protein
MKIPSTTLLLLSSALGAVEAFGAGLKTAALSSSTSLYAEVPLTRRSWLQSSSSVVLTLTFQRMLSNRTSSTDTLFNLRQIITSLIFRTW